MTDRDIQKDRLKEIVKDSLMKHIDKTCSLAENITNDLLANGVIVSPCKVGAEIFGLFDNDDEQRKEIYEGKVLCFSLDENNLLWARMRYKNGLTYWHTVDDFGKTVFLTKEKAEQALKERSGDNA